MTKAAVLPSGKTEAIVDPVCGMEVVPGKTKLVSVYNGHSYWFCARACREAFEKNPGKYLKKKKARHIGPFGRFLHRLAKANEEEFGRGGPSCCH
jgi:YHS domain-containing protein